MELPGRTGWNLLGDKTIEFARFPLDFINDRIKKYSSRLFLSRVLNKPTVFVTSNQGVKEMLYGRFRFVFYFLFQIIFTSVNNIMFLPEFQLFYFVWLAKPIFNW